MNGERRLRPIKSHFPFTLLVSRDGDGIQLGADFPPESYNFQTGDLSHCPDQNVAPHET
jgi:hypothetical protein